LKTVSMELMLFLNDEKLFQRIRDFLKLFPDKWRFLH
jgi:hypothetical protein